MGLIHTIDQWVDWTQEDRVAGGSRKHHLLCSVCLSRWFRSIDAREPFTLFNLRSKEGVRRVAEPCDIDGNEKVRWMRWKDPGSYVSDENLHLDCANVGWMMLQKRLILFPMKESFGVGWVSVDSGSA